MYTCVVYRYRSISLLKICLCFLPVYAILLHFFFFSLSFYLNLLPLCVLCLLVIRLHFIADACFFFLFVILFPRSTIDSIRPKWYHCVCVFLVCTQHFFFLSFWHYIYSWSKDESICHVARNFVWQIHVMFGFVVVCLGIEKKMYSNSGDRNVRRRFETGTIVLFLFCEFLCAFAYSDAQSISIAILRSLPAP